MTDKEKEQESGDTPRRRGIIIKLDRSMITALVAIFTASGFGIYNSTSGVGEWQIRDTRDGVTIQVNEANRRSHDRAKKLAQVVKNQQEEIAELYEAVDWMAAALEELGKSHPASWRKLRRTAPTCIDFTAGEESVHRGGGGGGAGMGVGSGVMSLGLPLKDLTDSDGVSTNAEDLLDDVEKDPEVIEFPAPAAIQHMQSIRGE